MKKFYYIIICTLSVLLTSENVFSHPHARLTAGIQVEVEDGKCQGFWVEWSFDDIFGTNVIREFDKDKNNSFNDKEIKDIYERAFINLKYYGYFVFLRKGNQRHHPEKVENFTAAIKHGRLYYKFYVPLKKEKFSDDFSVAIFDRSFYCDIKYTSVPVIMKLKTGEKPAFEISKNKNYPVYYNPLGAADDMKIYQKWQPGLETAYPDEIHIFFKK